MSVLINAALVLKERAKMYIKEGETSVEFDRKLVAFSKDCVRQCFKNYSSEDKMELMKLAKRIDAVIGRATSGKHKKTTDVKDTNTSKKQTNATTLTNRSVSDGRETTTTATSEKQTITTTMTNGVPVGVVPHEQSPLQKDGIVPKHKRKRPYTMATRLRDLR